MHHRPQTGSRPEKERRGQRGSRLRGALDAFADVVSARPLAGESSDGAGRGLANQVKHRSDGTRRQSMAIVDRLFAGTSKALENPELRGAFQFLPPS